MSEMEAASKYEEEPMPMASHPQLVASFAARALSVGVVILLFVLVFQYLGGLGWRGDSNFFNLHPFMMIFGVAFFITNGILSWRDAGRVLGHLPTKLLHLGFNAVGLGCIGLGLYVTIKARPAPHIVSLHSWFALGSAALLTIQALGGALFFALPIFPLSVRARVLPLHAWLGAVSYILLSMALLSGLVQWMVYKSLSKGQHDFMTSNTNYIANILGMFILATALCTAFAVLPRRNLEADIEERDGVRFDHPSRTRLKGGQYATTGGGGGAQYSTQYPTEAVPPRRAGAPVERETF